jgi:hypothetical protein
VRRLSAALATLVALALAGCQTGPATSVTHEAATLEGKGQCHGTYRVSWRYSYRRVGDTSWTPTPLQVHDCAAPTPLVSLPSFRVRGLRSSTRYEFRVESGSLWFDATGERNGHNYHRFTTLPQPMLMPRSAAEFRDSVGVVVHLPYYSTPYGDVARIGDKLAELGVKHVREGIWANSDPRLEGWKRRLYSAIDELAARGLKFNYGFTMDASAGTVPERLAAIAGRLSGTAASLEGPNDLVGGAGWESRLRLFQPALFAQAKLHASAEIRALPVIGPSFGTRAGPDLSGSLREWLDFGNVHPYTGCLPPSPTLLSSELQRAGKVSGIKPVFASEVGFHNALHMDPARGHPPCDERTAAIYVLRTVLEHFKSNIRRTFLYELIDVEPDPRGTDPARHFGLLRHDFSPKPAFSALKNLLALIGTTPPSAVSPLRFSVEDGPGDLRHLVLERGDGSHLVVLWRLVSVWDRDRRRAITVAPQRVEVSLPDAAAVSLIVPTVSSAEWPLPVKNGRIHVPLAGDPLVLRVR